MKLPLIVASLGSPGGQWPWCSGLLAQAAPCTSSKAGLCFAHQDCNKPAPSKNFSLISREGKAIRKFPNWGGRRRAEPGVRSLLRSWEQDGSWACGCVSCAPSCPALEDLLLTGTPLLLWLGAPLEQHSFPMMRLDS